MKNFLENSEPRTIIYVHYFICEIVYLIVFSTFVILILCSVIVNFPGFSIEEKFVPEPIRVSITWSFAFWSFVYSWVYLPFAPYILKALFLKKGWTMSSRLVKKIVKIDILLAVFTLGLFFLFGLYFGYTILFIWSFIISFSSLVLLYVMIYDAQRYYNITKRNSLLGRYMPMLEVEFDLLFGKEEVWKEEQPRMDSSMFRKEILRRIVIMMFHFISLFVWFVSLIYVYTVASIPVIVIWLLLQLLLLLPIVVAKFIYKFLEISGIKRKVIITVGLLFYFLSFGIYLLYPHSNLFGNEYIIVSLPVIAILFLTTILFITFCNLKITVKELEKLNRQEDKEVYLKLDKQSYYATEEKKEVSPDQKYLSKLKRMYFVCAILYYISILSPLVFYSYRPHIVWQEVSWNGFENLLVVVTVATHIYSYWLVPASPFLLLLLKARLGGGVSKEVFENMLKVNLGLLVISTGLVLVLTGVTWVVCVPKIIDSMLFLLFFEGVVLLPILLVHLMAYRVPNKIEKIVQRIGRNIKPQK